MLMPGLFKTQHIYFKMINLVSEVMGGEFENVLRFYI
jgi:hypothetical protein